jgi:sorting nexin-4
MKSRPSRGASLSEQGSGGVFENFTDTFLNAFTKVHKPDKRFIEVRDRADKLDEDLGHVEKIVARVARRQADLETDYSDLAIQFQKLITLEQGVEQPLTSFAASVETTSQNFKGLKDHTDQDYLGSLRDMEAYILALKSLLKAREQKQLDFEGLSDYLAKAAADRDQLANQHGSSGLGASGFLRSKIEDVRGVDHEQARRDRVRRLELQIKKLTSEVEQAKIQSETFDDRTVAEVLEFERIKAVELQDTLGGLADAHIEFFKGTIETWERFLESMKDDGIDVA